ncbi:hypothetical protein HMPREF1051_1832 [Neisseria sicca VK64]|uniref:Uncharacterized protein n=1 Tax=Neisseria sicca VK64 TaxID=1095748 RepID=I2NU91_NEISI|nr:hypothetical protein HMPREF1051_1832 [Neisseria sicca VK64]
MRHRFAGFATYSSGFRLNASSLRPKAKQAFDFSDDLKPFHQYSGLTLNQDKATKPQTV